MKGLPHVQMLIHLTLTEHQMPARVPGTLLILQANIKCLLCACTGLGFHLCYLIRLDNNPD